MDHFDPTSDAEGSGPQERVPHKILFPARERALFQDPLARQHTPNHFYPPDMPSIPHPPRRSPSHSNAHPQPILPAIPHPPKRNPPNPNAPPPPHRNEIRSKAPQPHLYNAQHPPQNNPLFNTHLSTSQLQARQQLITAYMMQNGAAPSGGQPFFFPGGGFPGPAPQSPQTLAQPSPAPKYTEVEMIVAELRDDMLKVLKSPNYKRCKSAKNIRQALRQVRTLCKEMRGETTELGKQKTNTRKKAATPEGEERQPKKQKGPDGKEAKNPEEVPKEDGEGRTAEDAREAEAGGSGEERGERVGRGSGDAAEESPPEPVNNEARDDKEGLMEEGMDVAEGSGGGGLVGKDEVLVDESGRELEK